MTKALVLRHIFALLIPFGSAIRALSAGECAACTGAGVTAEPSGFRTTTVNLGVPTVNLDRALRLAAELEDEELVRKMRAGK